MFSRREGKTKKHQDAEELLLLPQPLPRQPAVRNHKVIEKANFPYRKSIYLLCLFRLIHWALLLAGSIYVAVSVFSPDSGYMPIMTKVYIETNSESTTLFFW